MRREDKEKVPESPYDIFMQSTVSKIELMLNGILDKSSERELIMSLELKALLLNPPIEDSLQERGILVNFFELIKIPSFVFASSEIIVLSPAEQTSLVKALKFIEGLVDFHSKRNFKVSLVVFPRKTFLTKLIMEKSCSQRTLSRISRVIDLNLDFFPLDSDLLSLEYTPGLSNLFREKSYELHSLCAEALYKMQFLFGKFRNIATKGPESETVKLIMGFIDKEISQPLPQNFCIYSNLIIIDRTVDVITPLVTQFSYTGMLDDFQGISKNVIQLEKDPSDTSDSKKSEDYYLFKDSFFLEIKDLTQGKVDAHLKSAIRTLKQLNITNLPIEKAEEAAKQIKMKPMLEVHHRLFLKMDKFLISPLAIEFNRFMFDVMYGMEKNPADRLVELIQVNFPVNLVLRLLIFSNFVFSGFSGTKFDYIVKEMIESYGVQMIKPLLELEKNGLFVNLTTSSSNLSLLKQMNFNELRKQNIKFADSSDTANSYFYGGYSPISCKLIESFLSGGPNMHNLGFTLADGSSSSAFVKDSGLIVFFVGGVSYSEVAALRKVAKNFKNLLICTSNMINSNSLANLYTTF